MSIDLISKYNLDGYTELNEILNLYEIKHKSRSEISILINKNRLCGKKYEYNEDYFKVWSNNMAYILGFIAADGNISKDALSISLKYSDKELLEKIKSEFEYTGEVKMYKAKIRKKEYNACKLTIYSKEMCKDLINLGIVENKSFTINNFDMIPSEFSMDYIRGFFDGEGTVGLQYPPRTKRAQIRVRLNSGSEILLLKIRDYLKSQLNLREVTITKFKGREFYEICYSTKDSMKYYDGIYRKDDCLCLERKKLRFDECIRIRG